MPTSADDAIRNVWIAEQNSSQIFQILRINQIYIKQNYVTTTWKRDLWSSSWLKAVVQEVVESITSKLSFIYSIIVVRYFPRCFHHQFDTLLLGDNNSILSAVGNEMIPTNIKLDKCFHPSLGSLLSLRWRNFVLFGSTLGWCSIIRGTRVTRIHCGSHDW